MVCSSWFGIDRCRWMGPAPSPLRGGGLPAVGDSTKLMQELAFAVGQRGAIGARQEGMDFDDQVAAAAILEPGHTLTGKPDLLAVGGTGGNLEQHLPLEGRDGHLTAQ